MPTRRKEIEPQFTIAQVQERLNVSRATVWRWMRSGRLRPVVKIGSLVRIPESALVRLVEVNIR